MTQLNDEARRTPAITPRALVRRLALGAILACWALWLLSLPMSPYLFFAFDSEVSVTDGAILGSIQASWIVGIPVVLLFAGHIVMNGWKWPEWELRWLAVGLATALWFAILLLWLWTSATD
jgi:hypothetical protein